MIRTLGLFVCSALLMSSLLDNRGLAQSTDIVNSSSTTSGKIQCWTVRNGSVAWAFHVYTDASETKVNFRQFELHPAGIYLMKDTVVTVGGTAQPATPVVSVKLSPISGKPNVYTMDYKVGTTTHVIGWIKFTPGNATRASSDIIIRFKSGVVSMAGASSGTSPTAVTSGCDEPPADDIGEEELMDVSSSDTRTPAGYLSKTPAASSGPSSSPATSGPTP